MLDATVMVDELTFTEGVRWHAERVWFSDLYNGRVMSAREDGSDLTVEGHVDGIPSGLGWLPDGDLLVSVQDRRQVMRRRPDGEFVLHADLSGTAISFINDIVVDSDGTAYVGCFGFELFDDAPFDTAPLMKITQDGKVSVVGEPSYFPNGCFISDRSLIVAESMGNRISQYDIAVDGSLNNRRDWATFGAIPTATALEDRYQEMVVAADGISRIDAEGAIWVADFTKQYAVRVLPGGQIVDKVRTAGPVNCYSVALGGADGRTLFLCAAPAEMDPELRRNEPQASMQFCRVPVPLTG